MTSDPVQILLARLKNVKQTGDGQFMARCPAHDDQHASLSIGMGGDGRALVKCQAGCAGSAVLSALGMTWRDLHAASGTTPPRTTASPLKRATVAPETTTASRMTHKADRERFACTRAIWGDAGGIVAVAPAVLRDGGSRNRRLLSCRRQTHDDVGVSGRRVSCRPLCISERRQDLSARPPC